MKTAEDQASTDGAASGSAVEESSAQPAKKIDGIPLSNGSIAVLRKARGRDLEKGAALASNPSNPMSLMMGVVSIVAKIDGKGITYEDVLDLDMGDVMTLIGEVGGNVRVPSQLSAISS